MPETCTICGDTTAWNRSHISLHDETDSSFQHIQGQLCLECYEEIYATIQDLQQ